LLEEGRTALFQILNQKTQLDDQSLRNGFMLLWRKKDWQTLSTLLMRYLSRPLSDSETAWAYIHLAGAIAATGSAAGAVLAYETFERWIPGKSPILSAEWPHYPEGKDRDCTTYSSDEVRLLFLLKFAEFPLSYWNLNAGNNSESMEFVVSSLKAWYNSDYLAKVDALLSSNPRTQHNPSLHFRVLQQAANACASIHNVEGINRYIQLMLGLAGQCEDTSLGAELKIKALGQAVHYARHSKDDTAFTELVEEMMALLNIAAQNEGSSVSWIRGQRQALAFQLMRGNRYDLALQLWDANEASGGQFNGYGCVSYAGTIWKMTNDEERTLTQLTRARAQENRDVDMIPMFTRCPEFADVWENPAFLQAVSRE